MKTTPASKRARQKALKLSRSMPVADLDPELGNTNLPKLPADVLMIIYKLTFIREFYKLRVVCKDWNNVACERRCVTDPIPKPYFVLIQHQRQTGMKDVPSGTLAFNVVSGKWIWKPFKAKDVSYPDLLRYHRFDPVGDILEPFAQEGILFGRGCYHPSHLGYNFRSVEQISLFDVQAGRTILGFAALLSKNSRTVGMVVDISRKPHTVKVIVGSCSEGTQIFDSETKTSETKPSRMVRGRAPSEPDPDPEIEPETRTSPKSCISCKGSMYVWADLDEIQVYSIEEDKWSILNPPPSHAEHDAYRGLGHWEKEVYAVTRTEETTLSVWKLDGYTQEWSEFDKLPAELWAHLQPKAKEPRKIAQFVVVSHCNEYLLMHGATHGKARQKPGGRRCVLFNISNKRWEKVEMKEQDGRAGRN